MIAVNGREIETDAEGYLANLDDWSEEIAEYLSGQDNLELTENHWKILNWIRNYYQEFGTAPNLRMMQKLLKNDVGEELADKKMLFELFPYGPAKQGARYAGMPKPTGCV
jgi:tRNA 2-thiouridine synthesizing protein E